MKPIETDLPGVGTKTSLILDGGDHLEVVLHTNGTRDIAFFRRGDETPSCSMRLDSTSACALGVLLCAALSTENLGA